MFSPTTFLFYTKENKMFNEGKQERKYHTFLGRKYRVDALPCGIAIPFTVELTKLREAAVNTVFKLDPKTPSTEIFIALHKYYTENPEEAQKQLLQMIKALSVLTEFFTDGKVTEKFIQREANEQQVKDFLDAIQESQELSQLKKLKDRQNSKQ